MKRLLVLRHAKSSWKQDEMEDFDRPLNKRGKAAAPLAGRWLREEGLMPDRILCSSAKRARSTAKRVVDASGFGGDITFHSELYLAAPDAYLRFLKRLPDDVGTAMVVGHNPGLEALVEYFCGNPVNMPTAALAALDLPVTHWDDLELNGKATLVRFWTPRELGEELD